MNAGYLHLDVGDLGMAAFPAERAGRPPATAAVCAECLDLCREIITEEVLPDAP